MLYTKALQPCIKYENLDSELKTSTEKHCPKRNKYGSCRDIEFNNQISNVCDSAIWVRWRFTPSKSSYWSQALVRPGVNKIVSCKKSFNRCTGASEYQVKAQD